MNPNAKEFVPAHILKKRQEEAEAQRVDELSEKLEGVDLDRDNRKKEENGDLGNANVQNKNDGSKATTGTSNDSQVPIKGRGGDEIENSQNNNSGDHRPTEKDQYTSLNHHNNHQHTNGKTYDLEQNYDDHLLLKAGENYCEFNGEEFIVPGDDEEYEGEVSNAGYDFGNAEDNEDEDIANAFEEFLGNLPE